MKKTMGSLALLLRMVLLLTFVGWLFIWVMLPTKAYKQTWVPKLTSNLNSTYFLEQGRNLLLLTFPIMFIAALGGVYLHFQNSIKESNTKSVHKSQRLAFLKHPVLVMAPLGIVSIMELTFAVMFVVLMIWFLANYVHMSFGALHMDPGVQVWQSKFRSVSLRLGYVGNLTWAFLFFPVTRGSTILPLFGLTSESSIKYHIWLGHLSTILFFLHSVGFFIYWGMTHLMVNALEWSSTYVSNVAGEIAFVISLAMWVTSFPRFRRKMFEVFFYSHHLYTVYLLFYILHVGSAYLCMILPGIFLFLIDRYLRFLQSRHRAMLVSVRLLPCDTMELNFCKSPGLRYSSSSIMFVNVPKISKLQWHPFTINSSCNMESNLLSIVIKNQGSWSQKLYHELCSPLDHLDISVEGPYGPASSHFLSHESLVMICGGSGITPFISIIREIIYQSTQPNRRIPKLVLICAFKNSSDLTMLDLLLPMHETSLDVSKIEIQIQAYITQEHEIPTSDTKKLIQTVWFKPSPSDSPISAALGPNSWLWLSAIITSSFVMFLLLLAIVTRYYIYPRDHDSDNMPYHYSFRILWDMFLVCICIVICSSAIFLWQKRRNGNEQKQIQNFEMHTPTSSPAGAGLYGGDGVEVESLPHQSIVQATKVYYGERPDLKNILFGCKEADVGVLVCGPRKMRHEAAKICSSGLAKNLHFESISFNW